MKNKTKAKALKEHGITIVALVVTIVIMLILAAVVLRISLGDNGLINQGEQIADQYQDESEREALAKYTATSQLEEFVNEEGNKLGEELLDRNLENSDKWDIVIGKLDDDRGTYGTGWYLFNEGGKIPNYGELKHSWLVNYETGEVKLYDDKKYNHLSIKDMDIERDGLIINVDSSVIVDGKDKETLEKQLRRGS